MTKRTLRDAQGKTCTKCGEYKPFEDFYKLATTTDGRQSWCKACTIKHNSAKESRKRAALRAETGGSYVSPARTAKIAALRRGRRPAAAAGRAARTSADRIHFTYKVTLEEAARLTAVTSCGCCGRELSAGRGGRAIDHDYHTGKVRGVLCPNCNTGIGKLGDTLESVQRAVRYLTQQLDVLALLEHTEKEE